MNGASTKTDAAASEWMLDDNVTRLRRWGTEEIYPLPLPPINECTVGSAETCTVRITDPIERISRLHAQLVRGQTRWLLRDLGSKNGVRLDGARRAEIILEPCIEVGIGSITLIAESPRSIALRGFLARVLGWRPNRTEVIDHALRSIRMAVTHRVALVLCGRGDLVPMARSIHRRALGADRPFIVCDPRRVDGKGDVRSALNYESGMVAFAAAAGGSLCVRSRRKPEDFARVLEALHAPSSQVQLAICANNAADCRPFFTVPITVPPLASRPDEIDRIIDEYAKDAISELGTLRTTFEDEDRAWVRANASSLPAIEKATLRLIAFHESRNPSNAAVRLGMAPVSFSRWMDRRDQPPSRGGPQAGGRR